MLKKRHSLQLSKILPIIGVIIILSSISLPKKIVIPNPPINNVPVGEIYGDTKIGQTFVGENNNLLAIEMLLGTYNRKNQGVFYFHLKSDGKSKEDIFFHGYPTNQVRDNEFFRFTFPKIKNSKGKRYFFYIEAPKSQPGNAITIWSNSGDSYREGEKIVNGVPSSGDLVFKTEYERGLRLSFATFLGNISKIIVFLLNMFKNRALYFLLIIIISIWAFTTFSKKAEFFRKKEGFILVYLIFLLTVFIWIFISFSKKIAIFNQQKHTIPVGEIYGDTKIGQTFVAGYNNLSAIELLLATFDRKNSGEFIFHLKEDVQSQEDLFNYRGIIGKVKDNRYFKFDFPPISSSKGKKFYFYVEAPQSQPGNAITIWSNSKDSYQEGEKIVNGVASSGDLVFKTTYDSGLKNNFYIFLDNITQNKSFPLNKKPFYIILILLFALSISLFLTFLINSFAES